MRAGREVYRETRAMIITAMGPNSDSPVLHYLTTIIRPPAVRKEDPPQLTDILAVFLNSKTLPNDSAPAPRVLLTATPSPPPTNNDV